MELALIKRIAEIINERRTWINAELSPKQTPYLIPIDGTISVCYSCSLNLQCIEVKNSYSKKQKWIIPEVVLEKSARKIKAQDAAFWERFTTGQMNYQDVERLILDATYGIVKLTLDEYGICCLTLKTCKYDILTVPSGAYLRDNPC